MPERTKQQQTRTTKKPADIEHRPAQREAVIAGIQDGLLVLDKDWRCTHLNEAAAAFLDTAADKLIGKVVWEVFPASRYPRLHEEFTRAAEQKVFVRFEEFCEPLGHWYECACYPTDDGLTVVLHDTTSHKQAEEALRESEQRYRTLFESSRDGIIFTDMEGHVLHTNPYYQEILGYTPQELRALTYQQLTAPRWHEMEAAIVRDQVLPRGYSDEYEKEYIGKDGTVFPISIRVWLIRDEHGQPQGMWGIVRDITERKRAEEVLRTSEERLRLAQQAGWVGVFDWNLQNNTVVWTPELEELFGIPVGGFEGNYEGWARRVHPEDLPRVVSLFQEWMQSHHTEETWQYRFIRNDGQVRWMEAKGRILRDPNGKPSRMIGTNVDITERTHAEEALRRSEERYRRLFDEDLTGDFLATPDGKVIECNPAFAEIYGFADREQAGQCDLSRLNPGDWADLMARLRAECRVQGHECVHRRPDGREIHIVANVIGRFNEAAELTEVQGYLYDDTERKRAEESLRSTALFPEQNPSPTLRVARDGTLLYANGASAFLLRSWDCQAGHTVPDQIRQYVVQALDSQEITEANVVCDPITYSFSIAPIASEGYANLYGRDITERKHAEQQLFETKQRLEALMNALPVGVSFSDDPTCQNITGNPAVLAQFEVGPEDNLSASAPDANAPGRQVRFFLAGRQISDAELPLQRAVAENREIPPVELEVKLPSGRRWFAAASGAPIRDAQGNVVGGVAVTVDITERKRTEEALRELTKTLESKVTERTAEVEHRARQLQRLTLELSEAEDRERKHLAEILHDDLQQILAAAKFHLNVLRSRAKYDPSVQATAAQVDHMLKDAIDKSRSLSHDLSPAILHHGDFGQTLRWLAGQVQAKHGLIVHVDASGEVDVKSEPLKAFLYKAAQELLFNVVKHARTTEAEIRARRCGRCVCLSVSDRGRGFDPQELRETAGFGLFSIRERIELLGGRMRIKSAKGKGSKFYVVVPDGEIVGKGATAERGPEGRVQEGESKQPPRLRVLVADDHEIVREGLLSLLGEEHNIEVVGEAANGREAVDLAGRLRPDVVIMDVAMPLIDGDEATRQIKMHLPQTRVIALSMYGDEDSIERMRQAGAEAYVLKTAPSEELLAAIRGKR
jgi:PAS domain S-box-containing protein